LAFSFCPAAHPLSAQFSHRTSGDQPRIFGISMCAKQREVCEKFRKLKITKKTGLCLGFFSLNETPQKGCNFIYGIWRFICIRGQVGGGLVPLRDNKKASRGESGGLKRIGDSVFAADA
jgi:hypothetical protein